MDTKRLQKLAGIPLNEAAEGPEDYTKPFSEHAAKLGLKHEEGKRFAFLMKTEKVFHIMFQLDSPESPKVRINYVLGGENSKQYNVTIPLERFLSMDASELETLRLTLARRGEQYEEAIAVVKSMPAQLKEVIKAMVK